MMRERPGTVFDASPSAQPLLYPLAMPRRRVAKDTPAKLAKRMSRRWRVDLLRAKGEILGTVEAPDAPQPARAPAVPPSPRVTLPS